MMPLPLIFGRLVGFGRRAEIAGSAYLRSCGYRLLASRYRARNGEIDIVAEDGDCLVFVEVKARRRDPHPEDSVNYPKRRRIFRAARDYRARYKTGNRPYRFDVLTLRYGEGEDPTFHLIKDAFRASVHEA